MVKFICQIYVSADEYGKRLASFIYYQVRTKEVVESSASTKSPISHPTPSLDPITSNLNLWVKDALSSQAIIIIYMQYLCSLE